MYLRVVLIVFLFRFANSQDANCDYYSNVALGTRYTIQNPNYPNYYTPGVQCRWIATCPNGYNCRLDCTVNMPQSTSCNVDRLLISKTGDSTLASADFYCGAGSVSAVSSGQSISVGLITSKYSSGGTFKCDLYAQAATTAPTCSCGVRRSNRIVGGQETAPYEFPMMAGIVYRDMATIRCGGVIIANRYVLTAGHCVLRKQASDIAVEVGVYSRTNTASPKQTVAVLSIRIHPQFTEANYDYDIAIIGTEFITFNDYVSAVCMPFKFTNWDFSGALVTLLGWGTTAIGAPTSTLLRKVDVNVISQSTCRNSISTLTARQMCTYTRGKDACQDDSGGPALYTDPQTGLLFSAGIISYGSACASTTPGINTRVTELLSWIVQYAPADYCRK